MGDGVMDRYRTPVFRGDRASLEQRVGPESTVVSARGDNPLCGDAMELAVVLGVLPDGSAVIERACWNGYGCSLC
ncbi:MAG: iron-sulfur cluster assembly scaffold protein, partial [Gordonibacter sp.]|uniref:iron-sulfur cluster assembly scaffold protein n=1 Tax=Gordonibacter sp. TaxID=1968902 RepID=UPI002FCC108E